jgi:hypothetical protein
VEGIVRGEENFRWDESVVFEVIFDRCCQFQSIPVSGLIQIPAIAFRGNKKEMRLS